MNKSCVCDGFAKTFRLLCDLIGISCIVVNGVGYINNEPERHSWNIVRVGEDISHVDVTWDCNLSGHDYLSYFYFMMDDHEFSKDHKWDRSFYPKCDYKNSIRVLDIWNQQDLAMTLSNYQRKNKKHLLIRLHGSMKDKSVFEGSIMNVFDVAKANKRIKDFRYSIIDSWGHVIIYYDI